MTREANELMVSFVGGDSSAFDELCGMILPQLHSWFHAKTRDWHLAEDLTSETIMNIASRAATYCDGGRFFAWMYRIARNVLTNSGRKKRVKTISDSQQIDHPALESLVSRDSGPDEIAEIHEESQIAMSHLQSIIPEQSDALWRFCCGESMGSIADLYDAPLPTIKRRAQIAKQKLQLMMVGDAA